jgi:EF-P beta-lysylation protein EpmB
VKLMTKPAADNPEHDTAPSDLNWRAAMSRAFCRNDDLLTALQLTPDESAPNPNFPLRAPRGFVDRMQTGDPGDPLLRQVLPTAAEARIVDGYTSDPVGDLESSIAPGVLHKYSGRALLVVTGACAIHCRYCFRRAYPYASDSLSRRDFQAAIDALEADPTIEEIILSGGDPLTLTNDKLATMLDTLAQIRHIRRIRIHTRIPVVLPERIDSKLLTLITACPLPIVIVIHSNHAREIDDSVATAVSTLIDKGATLLNQSVLLRGINDSTDTLIDLSKRLFEIGVLPYYLHQLDPVAGAAHFNVETARAIELIDAVTGRLPGYLVPRLVKEIPGESAKKLLHGML